MPLPDPHPACTLPTTSPAIGAFIEGKMKAATDALHDHLRIPRKGREPDYLYGRWCVKCHNSLPQEWVEPCDVCGAATVIQGGLDGLLIWGKPTGDPEKFPENSEMYGGIPRAKKEE